MKFRFPDPLVLLVGCVLLGAAASWVVPAGEYERTYDAAADREVVVAGTYESVEPDPVGPFEALVAIPRGLLDAGEVVFLVFLVGAAFYVIDATGAVATGIRWMIRQLGGRDHLIIPIVSLFFAVGGVTQNMQEEIIALIPIVVLLCGRMGYTPVVAAAMCAGPAFVGAAFSPLNPFQVGIAQKVAEVELLSGWAFRSVFLVIALAVWIALTMRHARATRGEPAAEGVGLAADLPLEAEWEQSPAEVRRHLAILGLVAVTFVVLVWGLLARAWGFNHLSALFFAMGAAGGLLGRLGLGGTADAFGKGFRAMAFAAILVGVARAIFVVLEDGRIVDTIVHGLFTPVADLPLAVSGLGMMAAHIAVHVPVPSVSGHAVLTMPILAPLADLLGMSRQVAVLAYQYGAGTFDMITPTNGSLLAILAAGGLRYDEWLKFAWKPWLALTALGAGAILIALWTGLS